MSSEISDNYEIPSESLDDEKDRKEQESTTALIQAHIKEGPRKELWEHEKQRLYILSQCSKCSNVLYADFRADEICFSYYRFKELGLSLKELFAFQNKVPVVYPWNSEYDTLRQDVNRRFNVFPLMIVMARTSCDVVCSFKFAQEYKIPIRIRGGSHSFEGYSLSDGMIIDQSRRKKIYLDLKKKRAVIEPGVLLGPLADQLSKYGLVLVSGTCSNNNATGLALGGGIGFLSRTYAMTSDSILGVEVLLADGTIVKANRRQHSDLYWAHQGACGNNYGIVLSMKVQLYSIPTVVLFEFTYPFDRFKEVLKIWQDWFPRMPNELNTEFSARNNRGNVVVNGQYIGKEKTLRKLLEPFSAIKSIESRIEEVPYIEAVKYFTGLARWLPFFKTKNAFLSQPFPPQAIDTIVDFMSRGDGRDIFAIPALGGKNDEIPPDATAFVHRKGTRAWLLMNAHWSDQSDAPAKIKWVTEFYDALKPYLSGFAYQNAPDITLKDYLHQYYGSNLDRLVEVKQKYDPENVFNYPQSIPVEL